MIVVSSWVMTESLQLRCDPLHTCRYFSLAYPCTVCMVRLDHRLFFKVIVIESLSSCIHCFLSAAHYRG